MDIFFWMNKKTSVDKDIKKLKDIRSKLEGQISTIIYKDKLLEGTQLKALHLERELSSLFSKYEDVRSKIISRRYEAIGEIDNMIAQKESQSCSIQDEINKNKEVS